jgi:hypothetical protein
MFFLIIFIFEQYLDPNLNPNIFSDLDSDPAKTFGFIRIQIHNTAFSQQNG